MTPRQDPPTTGHDTSTWPLAPLAIGVALVAAACSGSEALAPTTTAPAGTEPVASEVTTPGTDASPTTEATTQPPAESTAAPETITATAESTTTATAESTTESTTTAASTTIGQGAPPVLDLSTGDIGGYTFGGAATGLIDEFTTSLGEPSTDTGWLPVGPIQRCSFNEEYRYVGWGDLRFLLERSPAEEPVVAGWTLGDETLLGPPPPDDLPGPATGISTASGVGLGSSSDDIGVEFRTFSDGERISVVGAPVFGSVADGAIAGLVSGPLDCPALDLSQFSCDRAIPIRELPDGTRTDGVTIDEDAAVWGIDTAGPEGQNVVTQVLAGPDPDVARVARESTIAAQVDPLDIRVVTAEEPATAAAEIFVFDEGTDCVRLLRVGPGLDRDALQAYADVLADRLEERR